MARINLTIPALGNNFVDLRDSIPGDSFNWSWARPLSQVNYLAIHHTAGPDTQTPDEIANFHINSNGWGGIGYHFLIAKNGTVFYVGDISTARANVANLNEQVLGICLVGNFTSGRVPSSEQFDSAHKLCDFFIENFPDLSNVNSWDALRGHKELLGQSTTCPGDNWPLWRPQIVEGIQVLDTEEINLLKSQVENLQASLSSVNRQILILQETIQEKDQEIADLKNKPMLTTTPPPNGSPGPDHSLTIVGALINLYKFIFPPGKVQ